MAAGKPSSELQIKMQLKFAASLLYFAWHAGRLTRKAHKRAIHMQSSETFETELLDRGKNHRIWSSIPLSKFLKLKMILKSRKMVPKSMLHNFKSLETTQKNAERPKILF